MTLDYTTRGSYICLFMSFFLIWGSIIVGSAVLYAMPMATGSWYRMVSFMHDTSAFPSIYIDAYEKSFLRLWHTAYSHVSISFELCRSYRRHYRYVPHGGLHLLKYPAYTRFSSGRLQFSRLDRPSWLYRFSAAPDPVGFRFRLESIIRVCVEGTDAC